MTIVSGKHQAIRWLSAVAVASALLLALLALILVPKVLSIYFDSPCRCDRCAERNLRQPSTRRIPGYYAFGAVAILLLGLRRVAEAIYLYCSIEPWRPGAANPILFTHAVLAHMAIRRSDRLRSRHLEDEPDYRRWSKDRIFPVQPPLNSIYNCLMVLSNSFLGLALCLTLTLLSSRALYGEQKNILCLFFEPKGTAIAITIAIGLLREFCHMASMMARIQYDLIEVRSNLEWQMAGPKYGLFTELVSILFS